MSELPYFSFNTTFDPNDAWHDKIEWSFTPAVLEGDHEEILSFLYSLSCPDKFSRDQDPSSSFGWLFGQAASNRRGYSRPIRKSTLDWGDDQFSKPLFTGGINLQMKQNLRHLKFGLQVNPSRLIHHHPAVPRDEDEIWRHRGNLSSSHPIPHFDGEFSLDGKDNWIPQSPRYRPNWRRPYSTSGKWLRRVLEAAEFEVQRAAEISVTDLSISADQKHSIQKVETYWEFQHDDPPALVRSLKQHLLKYSRNLFRSNHYRQSAINQEEVFKNCLSLIATIGRGEVLAVYAKTNKRVRFEIRHDLASNPRWLGGRRTAANIAGLLEVLERVRRRSAEQMTEVFHHLQRQVSVDSSRSSSSELLSQLATALRNSEHFSTILSLLLTNGKIERVPALTKELRALSSAGIIESNGKNARSGSYAVTLKYSDALRKLQSKGMASELGPRER